MFTVHTPYFVTLIAAGNYSYIITKIPSYSRNPVHSKRPSFADIGRSLSTSVDLLLQWVEEDSSISPQVGVLGAPLSEADSLYKDLQNVYADTK